MKRKIFIRLTALLLVFVIGLFLPACSASRNDAEPEITTVDLPVITDETKGEFETETEDNKSHAPPEESQTQSRETEDETSETAAKTKFEKTSQKKNKISEDGKYDSRDEVALYIHTYGHLPSNYITKKQAQNKGWSGGSLKKYAPGCSIGGDRFGNYEGLLPKAKGRTYTECDIGTMNASSRGAKRIIFSNDGLIFYTDDHYESFTQLY